MNMHTTIGSTFRHAQFGRGSVVLEARGDEPLSIDEIASRCPSVVAGEAHHSRSERYTFISTLDMVRGMAKEGFFPHYVMQGGSKDEEKRGYTKHMVRFRSSASNMIRVEGSRYEVIVVGSHDGTTSEQIFGGFFRAVCKNGTMWFDGEATKIKIPHKGNVLDQVVDAAYTVVSNGTRAADQVEHFQHLDLSADERLAYAKSAAVLRFGTGDDAAAVDPVRLLTVKRESDKANDLWTVFNRVQENTVRGGVGYVQNRVDDQGRTRRYNMTTRPVLSVDGDVKLNTALWTLTQEMARLKAA